MIKSMTAYSRLQKNFSNYTILCELQSVNRKHLDIQCYIPKELASLEHDIRNLLTQSVSRGQVIAHIHIDYKKEAPFDVTVSSSIAKKMHHALNKLAATIDCKEVMRPESLMTLFVHEGVIKVRPQTKVDPLLKKAVLQTVAQTMKQLNKMRVREGAYLAKEFRKRLQIMKKGLYAINTLLPVLGQRYKKRLEKQPMDTALSLDQLVSVYHDKIDISEELSRFSYHVDHILEIIRSKEQVGKLIEFVLQELLREANTMGSKVQDTEITKHIVLLKNEIEKVREQIQNVE